MMRSKELRSVTRSLITGKALARQGSIVIVSASWKWRMCNWHVAVPRWPPCGTPLMTSEHMPQMPSRQSESKAIGSSLRAMSSSFTTSCISRKDISGRTAFASYVLKRPGVVAFFWRQTFRVRFMTAKWRMTNDPAKRERKNDEIRMTKQLRLLQGHVRVSSFGFFSAFGDLEFLAEMAAAGFAAMQGVEAKQLGELHEVRDPPGVLQVLVQLAVLPGDIDIMPEFFTQFWNALERFLQPGFVARHAALVPEQFAQFPMQRGDRAFALDGKQFRLRCFELILRSLELRVGGRKFGRLGRGQIMADGARQDEIAVGQALHQSAGAEAVGAVVREIGLAQDKEARQGAH